MDSEASDYYVDWYYKFKERLARKHEDSSAMLEHRRDLHMLKIAMLLRAAEYRPGREVGLSHIQTADKLISRSITLSANSLEGVGVSDYSKILSQVRDIVKKKKLVTRRQLLTAMSKNLDADTLTRIIEQLIQEGSIKAYFDRTEVKKATRRGREYYVPYDRRIKGGE